MADTVQIKGLAELQRALDTLPAKIEANIMRGAVRAGVKVIAEAAAANAPVQTGSLKLDFNVGTRSKAGMVTGRLVVGRGRKSKGGTKKAAFYAHFVEFGTKPHRIKARRGKALAIGVSAVNHPGARPKPFLRPALDAKAQASVEAVAAYIRKRLADKHGIDVPAPREEFDE